MFALPLPLVVLEVLIFSTFVHFYGFWDVFLAYFLPSVLGVLLLSFSGRNLVLSLQSSFSQGQLPSDNLLHRGAVLLGSLLLIIPMFTTRVFAVFLIVPLLRHLAVFIFKAFLFKRLAKSTHFTFIRTGGGGPFGFGGGFKTQSDFEKGFSATEERPREREAEVVDVTPIQITHSKIEDDKASKK